MAACALTLPLHTPRHPFLSTAFNPPSAATRSRFHGPPSLLLPSPPLPRASADPGPGGDEEQEPAAGESDAAFENRLSQIRLKYRSGTGKKAEQRRAKRSAPAAASSSSSSKKGSKVMLPPVPLREPVSAGGMKVDFGFSAYSEWINGRLAVLGLAALVLVELGSGKGLLSYHAPPILFIQIYTVAAVATLFVKYEKERISVWPKAPPPSPSSDVGGD